MSRILLVDDSPHAQRMGERILSDEGYEVVTVSNADSALIRVEDVDPDVVLADTVMPGRTGYDLCQYLKMNPKRRHVRVLLTVGALEPLDEERARAVESDGLLKKPFEATALLAAVKPLAEAAAKARSGVVDTGQEAHSALAPVAPFVAVVDAEQVCAAVTVALDASMDSMVAEITRRVLAALQPKASAAETEPPQPQLHIPKLVRKPEPGKFEFPGLEQLKSAPPAEPMMAPPPEVKPAAPPAPQPAPPPDAPPVRVEPIRRINPLRGRTGSILGLDLNAPGPEPPGSGGRKN